MLVLFTGVQDDGVVAGTIADSSTSVKSITTGTGFAGAVTGVLAATTLDRFAAAALAAVAGGVCDVGGAAANGRPPACKIWIFLFIAGTDELAAGRGVPTNRAVFDRLAGSPRASVAGAAARPSVAPPIPTAASTCPNSHFPPAQSESPAIETERRSATDGVGQEE